MEEPSGSRLESLPSRQKKKVNTNDPQTGKLFQADILFKAMRVNEVGEGEHIPKGGDGQELTSHPYFSGK